MPNHALLEPTGSTSPESHPPTRTADRLAAALVFFPAAVLAVGYYVAVSVLKVVGRGGE